MSTFGADRVPPHNLDAEASVLGGVLLRNDALMVVAERGVTPADFYHPAHRAIFAAMLALDAASRPIDVITVADALQHDDGGRDLQGVEGLLADLAARVPTAENIGHYARIVREKASLRGLIATCTEFTGRAFADPADARQLLDRAAGAVCALAEQGEVSRCVSAADLTLATMKEIERRYGLKRGVSGIPTGFADLDARTCGLQPAELVILAGRPGRGKSALMLNLARHAGCPVLIFSLEMSQQALNLRQLACEGRIDGLRLKNGQLEGQEWARLASAASTVMSRQTIIADDAHQTLLSIRAQARRWRNDRAVFPAPVAGAAAAPGLVLIDFLQKVDFEPQRGESRDQAIGRGTWAFKALAKELQVPVIVLSALNRDSERRGERPTLESLRESGNIESDADVVLFVHRDESDKTADPRAVELIIGKQRNGPTGIVPLLFFKEYSRFETPTQRDDTDGIPSHWTEEGTP